MAFNDLPTVVLCGGRGTRAYPYTETLPKPLLEVAGRPILGHVLEIYARQGCRRFVLAAGYLADRIEDFAADLPGDWDVTVVDTGLDTATGERIRACRDLLGDRFFATYGDGLGNVDLSALVDFHDAHPGLGTLTTVPLPSQYGTVDTVGSGQVTRFSEKPILRDHWINGGFFVFDAAVFDHWTGTDLEQQVLPALAAAELLHARRHDGFWKSMDTWKDSLELTRLGTPGAEPWFAPAPADRVAAR